MTPYNNITKYAPVRLQDEGAFRGATCFYPLPASPPFPKLGEGRGGGLEVRDNGRSRFSYNTSRSGLDAWRLMRHYSTTEHDLLLRERHWPFDTAFATQGKQSGFHRLADRLAPSGGSLDQLRDYLSLRGSFISAPQGAWSWRDYIRVFSGNSSPFRGTRRCKNRPRILRQAPALGLEADVAQALSLLLNQDQDQGQNLYVQQSRDKGDEANLAARLASKVAADEIILSQKALAGAGMDGSGMESRRLELKGISDPVRVRVMRA